MVNVELVDVFVERGGKEKLAYLMNSKGKRWYAMAALRLRDVKCDAMISEWFYLVVCSPGYINKPLKIGPKYNPKYVVIQEKLDLDALKLIASKRLEQVNAKNWTDFFRQMEEYFLHDD